MLTAETLKGKITGKFEGGNSFNLNWSNIFKEATQNMIKNISPKKLMRETPIYGGYVGSISMYYCPVDMGAPKGLYKQLQRLNFDYVPAIIFDRFLQSYPSKAMFTTTYKNGAQFILINGGETNTNTKTLSDMSSTLGISSAMVLTLNTYDYLTGNSTFMGQFTDTLTYIKGTLAETMDISDMLFGCATLNVKLIEPKDIASISIKLKTDDSNYYLLTANDAIPYLIQGYNFIKVNMSTRQTIGVPVDTNITAWEINIVMNTGKTQIILVDNLNIYSGSNYDLNYASRAIIVDKTTGLRKVEVEDMLDLVDIDDEEEGIFIYEACRVVVQESTNDNVNSNESLRFDKELGRQYALYFEANPSSEMPLSYNVSDEDRALYLS